VAGQKGRAKGAVSLSLVQSRRLFEDQKLDIIHHSIFAIARFPPLIANVSSAIPDATLDNFYSTFSARCLVCS
jgi:hypothetical protein